MKLSDYKADTIARTDVKDIVKFEPVERNSRGEVIITLTEAGKTLKKYDVHLMREVDGNVVFDKEYIAVLDEGKETEEVVYRAQTTRPEVVTESQIETYIKNLPFLAVRILEMDTQEPWVKFQGVQVTGVNAGKEVQVFAYRDKTDGDKPKYLILE